VVVRILPHDLHLEKSNEEPARARLKLDEEHPKRTNGNYPVTFYFAGMVLLMPGNLLNI
jgi:hypothetical protein